MRAPQRPPLGISKADGHAWTEAFGAGGQSPLLPDLAQADQQPSLALRLLGSCSNLQTQTALPANKHVRLPELAENKPGLLPGLSANVPTLCENCLQTSVCARII